MSITINFSSGLLGRFRSGRFLLGCFAILAMFLCACLTLYFCDCWDGKEEPQPLDSHPAITLLGNDSRLALSNPSWSIHGDEIAVTGKYLCGLENCEHGIFTLHVGTGELLPLGEKGRTDVVWMHPNTNLVSYYDPISDGIYNVGIGGLPESQKIAEGQKIVWSIDGNLAAIVDREDGPEFGFSRSLVYIRSGGQDHMVFETPKSLENDITGFSWSFDSTHLAISARWLAGSEYKSAVFIVNTRDFSTRQYAENIEQPGWMIGNNWLFFIRENSLRFAPLNRQCEKFPLEQLVNIHSPTLSPNGNRIAFEYESKIYILDLSQIRDQLSCEV